MKWLRIRLTMRGPFATPWQADTIWGHLAWGLLYTRGEIAMREFLEAYRDGDPPLLLSDGFPRDVLPRPLISLHLPPPATSKDEAEASSAAREARRRGYVQYDDFLRALAGETVSILTEEDEHWQSRASVKNAIDRSLGIAAEGILYSIQEWFWHETTIYARVADSFMGAAHELFEYLKVEGYGKRRSAGYGAIRQLEAQPFDGFDSPPDANGFVSLSAFVPAASDPTEGWWRVRVKHGRLGEHFAYSSNPFKRPLVMLEAGSTFYDKQPRPFYGRLVEDVSPAVPEVVHYGFALAVPMRLPEKV